MVCAPLVTEEIHISLIRFKCLTGDVSFQTSCSDVVTEDFNTAMSMLYSFWYSQALKQFDDIISREPSCCMAYYGASMTYNRPVWDYITDERLVAAEVYASQAATCAEAVSSAVTDREAAYIAALGVYMNSTDPAVQDPASRLRTYANTFYDRVYIPYGPTDENSG